MSRLGYSSSPATLLSDATPGGTWTTLDTTIAYIAGPGVVGGVSGGVAIITYTTGPGCFVTYAVTVYSATDECSPCFEFGTSGLIYLHGPMSSIPGGPYFYVDDDVTISGSATFSHDYVFVAPGKHIYVDSNSSLTISGSHLFSCSGMWEGITLRSSSTSTGRLVLEADADGHSTLIEDARTAVTIANPVAPSAGGSYILSTSNTIFNRNITGIYISHYNANISSYPFLIHNTVFTSRDISAHFTGYPTAWPKTWSSAVSDGSLKHSYTASDVFKPPFTVDDPNALGTGLNYPGVACKNTALPTYGIRLDSVGTYTASTAHYYYIYIPSSYAELKIGDEGVTSGNLNQNLFDNQRYGIYATNSNFTCVNNAFINMYSSVSATAFGADPGGYGVYAIGTSDKASIYRLRVYSSSGSIYNNQFYGFRIGVGCSNYFDFTGTYCMMRNRNTGLSGDMSGALGFSLKTAKYSQVDVSFDTISNVSTGISFWIAADPTYISTSGVTYPSQLVGLGNFTFNKIQAHPDWSATLTTQRVNSGIVVQDPIIAAGQTSVVTRNLNVSGNIIHDAYNGIYVNHYWAQGYAPFTDENTIDLRRRTPGSAMQYGINHTHSRASYIHDNHVNGHIPPGSTVNPATSDSIRAYYSSGWNSLMDLGCNDEINVGRGYEFLMNNLNTNWHDNHMENNMKGMVLNGGIIGPQYNGGTIGSPLPMNNYWDGSWSTSNVQTYVRSTHAYNSKFYVNGSPSTKYPTINDNDPLTTTPPDRYIPTSSIITLTVAAPACLSPTSPVDNDSSNLFNRIAQEHIDYLTSTIPSNWMGQYTLWKTILMDSTLVDSSATIYVFDSLARISRYKYLTDIEQVIAMGEFDSATVMLGYNIDSMANTSWDTVSQVRMADDTTADYIVQNYQQFYSLYMKYATAALTGSDSLAIYGLASLCPEINGGVVFQARALYSLVYEDLSVFNDDSCLTVDSTYMASRHSNENGNNGQTKIGQQHYRIYPNPNDGTFVIQQYKQDTGVIKVVVLDAVGRNVYKGELQFNNGLGGLNIGQYPPGLYLLELTDAKKQIFRAKFVISK